MKRLTVEIVRPLAGFSYLVVGRCCADDIRLGDSLFVEGASSRVGVVKEISVYRHQYELLAHGYVGNVILSMPGPPLLAGGHLVDDEAAVVRTARDGAVPARLAETDCPAQPSPDGQV